MKQRILYVPEGKFLIGHIENTVMVINSDSDNIEEIIEEILAINEDPHNKYIAWRSANNLTVPILREELEIVDD